MNFTLILALLFATASIYNFRRAARVRRAELWYAERVGRSLDNLRSKGM